MKYIVFDLEFNQKFSSEKNIPELPFEILQIGALKLDTNFNILSTFNRLVKPVVYKKIHPYIGELTKITDEMISNCKEFKDIYYEFLDFLGDDEVIFVTWGAADIRELFRNVKYFDLEKEKLSKKYIDMQEFASKYYKAPKGSRIGLRNVIDFLSIPLEGDFHDAYNDAYYTAHIFKLLYTDEIEIKKYTPTVKRKPVEPKEKVDTKALIAQFEKMYDRKLTKDEESMIQLSYIMGKTKQFLIPSK